MSVKTTTVHIYGESYPITGSAEPEYIARIAEYVDSKMNQAAEHGRVKAKEKVAILAALSIASELAEERLTGDRRRTALSSRVDVALDRIQKTLELCSHS